MTRPARSWRCVVSSLDRARQPFTPRRIRPAQAGQTRPGGSYRRGRLMQCFVALTRLGAYERDYISVNAPDPVEAIKFRMEQMGLSRKDLEPFLGSRARVSEVLNKRRGPSLAMIRSLHENLQIPLDSLIGEVNKA